MTVSFCFSKNEIQFKYNKPSGRLKFQTLGGRVPRTYKRLESEPSRLAILIKLIEVTIEHMQQTSVNNYF